MSSKGLQKFTDFDKIMTREDYGKLSKKEGTKYLSGLLVLLNEAYSQRPIDGETTAKILDKMYTVLDEVDSENYRNQTWQSNHVLIQNSVHGFIKVNARFPLIIDIASDTGLTRQTIHKHFKESGKDYTSDELKMIPIMATRLLSSVYQLAVEYGDLRAYKLFLDHAGNIVDKPQSITINNTQINIQTINQLPEKVQVKIERMINANQ